MGPFEVEHTTLRGASRGLQGLLIPEREGHFRLLVDPEPPGGWNTVDPKVRGDLERHRSRFLIAHELAHSFFYKQTAYGLQPQVPASPDQEVFCDEFARSLLLPSSAAADARPTAAEIVRLHREYDVSIELAARALVAAHGDALACWVMVLQADGPPFEQWRCRTTYAVNRRNEWLSPLIERARINGEASTSVVWQQRGSSDVDAVHLPRRRQVVAVATSPQRVAA